MKDKWLSKARNLWLRVAPKLGKAVKYTLVSCLCCAVLVLCVTGGILMSEFVNERAEHTRTHLFDWLENASAKFKGVPSDVKLRQEGAEISEDTVTPEETVAAEESLQQTLCRQVKEMADRQEEIDRLMLEELHSGAYTLDAPFSLLDPYGVSPLTAVLLFTTEEPMRIDIHIPGDTPQAEVDFSFSEYETEHMIPVYGLYADRANAVTVTATNREGVALQSEVTVQTDVLSANLANTTVQARTLDAESVQPGFTFTYRGDRSGRKTAIDINGDFRWYLNSDVDGSLLNKIDYPGDYNGGESLFVFCGSVLDEGPSVILELNFLGKLLNAWYSPYGVHHEIEPDETGLLLAGSIAGAYEGFVYHINRETGEIDKTIDYSKYLQVLRDQCRVKWPESDTYYTRKDWMHLNTIVSYEGDLIVSARNQSTVLCSDWDGNIKWMLCDPTGYYESYKQYILTPVGDNFEYFYVQHAPEVLPDQDGNPDTIDILLFDNGDFRMEIPERTSRLIQYRINEKEMTAELVWIWGSDKPELYSKIHGDADFLENGNRLGSFQPYDSRLETNSAYGVEVAKDGHVVWEMWRLLTSDSYYEYRLERLEIYADSANDLHIGEQANLFLPEE